MFNFTGSVGRPRNVNLSGKKSSSSSSSPFRTGKSGPSSSLASAREQRAARAAEQRRKQAAERIQRTWRGRSISQRQRNEWRSQWDQKFGTLDMTSGRDEQRRILLDLITLFLGISTFGRPCENRYVEMKDEHRLAALVGVTACRIRDPEFWKDGDRRMRFLLRGLATALFRTIPRQMHPSPAAVLPTLMLLPELVPLLGDTAVGEYYKALSTVAAAASRCPELVEPLVHAVTEPLGSKGAAGVRANHMCITSFLTTPNLLDNLGASPMTRIRKSLALERISWSDSYLEKHISSLDSESRLWLLAHAIYLIFDGPNDETPVIDLTGDASPRASFGESFLELLSQLLSPVAVEISQRINIVDVSMEGDESDVEDAPNKDTSKEPLPLFVKKQLEWLVQPSSIYGLLLKTHSQSSEVQVLARFALTLLVAFPHKRNELRMWLCLAKTQDGVPAVRYVWNRVKDCSIFRSISVHFRQAVNALKPAQTHESPTGVEEELNLIFLFLEMYAFLLTVTDDNEFFAGYKPLANGRQLELSELKELTVFLKNLGFAMYWCSGEILGGNAAKDNGSDAISQQRQDSQRGWEIKQFREVVTNVTRAIYARDSRRRFLPKDHWLMTEHLSMEGLISAVVEEEEKRRTEFEAASEEDEDEGDANHDENSRYALDPTAQRHRRLERMRREHQRNQRANYLAAIAPRLEILQNLPFFIPFETRVKIFRDFVANDKTRRRLADHSRPVHDLWDESGRHHARIGRGREFEDALAEYWAIGEGLKDPIQITFLDVFGNEEAGIDGGGVTKEFLISVVNRAFAPEDASVELAKKRGNLALLLPPSRTRTPLMHHSIHFDRIFRHFTASGEMRKAPTEALSPPMFCENAEHQLYPHPTIIDSSAHVYTQVVKDAGLDVVESELAQVRSTIIQRFEFAGRIMGKCLYEGILVDIQFAPFFLLKWSQPNNSNAVGINDLRDLDAGFYTSLMQLKDYDGDDVETVFGLNFTVDAQIAPGRIVTRELKTGGADIPVTKQNRLEYIHLISRYRLSIEQHRQTAAFLRGLSAIIRPEWLRMFNQSELQTLVGGLTGSPIDVEDLRRNTVYSGLYAVGDDGVEHPTIKLFWEVMHEMSDEERGKVLQFVTSVSRPPLLGFGQLRPLFSIRDAGDDQSRLCTASTCVNLMKLPRYKTKKVLKEKLLYSVNSGAGFDLS